MTAVAVFFAVAIVGTGATHALNPFETTRRLDAAVVAFMFVLFGGASAVALRLGPVTGLTTFLSWVMALLPGVVVTLSTVSMRRRLHWNVQAVLRQRSPERLASLKAHLAKKSPLQHTQDARRAAWVLALEGEYDMAEQLVSAVPLSKLRPVWKNERAVLLNDRAAYRLRLGHLDGAREALEAARPYRGAMAGPLDSKRALLAAVEGDAATALGLLDALRLPATSLHRQTADLARAHAEAGRGHEAESKVALRRLAAADPARWLARTATPAGPATPLAVALAAEEDSPYR